MGNNEGKGEHVQLYFLPLLPTNLRTMNEQMVSVFLFAQQTMKLS
jgi:hypothetical protein